MSSKLDHQTIIDAIVDEASIIHQEMIKLIKNNDHTRVYSEAQKKYFFLDAKYQGLNAAIDIIAKLEYQRKLQYNRKILTAKKTGRLTFEQWYDSYPNFDKPQHTTQTKRCPYSTDYKKYIIVFSDDQRLWNLDDKTVVWSEPGLVHLEAR